MTLLLGVPINAPATLCRRLATLASARPRLDLTLPIWRARKDDPRGGRTSEAAWLLISNRRRPLTARKETRCHLRSIRSQAYIRSTGDEMMPSLRPTAKAPIFDGRDNATANAKPRVLCRTDSRSRARRADSFNCASRASVAHRAAVEDQNPMLACRSVLFGCVRRWQYADCKMAVTKQCRRAGGRSSTTEAFTG